MGFKHDRERLSRLLIFAFRAGAIKAISKHFLHLYHLSHIILISPALFYIQLFQLRSIEQNELAIIADSQNKAILIFTGVTVIFLPLSFCASYFGMNLKGVVDVER